MADQRHWADLMSAIQQMLLAAGGSGVVSLLNFNGADASITFTDQTGKVWSPFGNAQIDTAQSKYGGASGLFDGSGDYITTPNHPDFDFGAGEFTIQAWVRFNSVAAASYQGLVVHDAIGGTRGWLLITQSASEAVNDALNFTAFVGATPYAVADTVAQTAGGAFKHVAAVRDLSGGTDLLRLYKDGVQVASTAITGSINSTNQPCVSGVLWGTGSPGAGTYFNGWLDDLEIRKGQCLYPGGTTFTPPTSELTYP